MPVSVVIPAYNEEKYLPRTLEALEAALTNLPGTEIIVVDNESTDATREIAESHRAKIVNEHEHNIGRVRNTGGIAATGDVIIFLDADTLVAPGLFEKIDKRMSDPRCIGGSVAVEYEPHYQRPWMRFYLGLALLVGRLAKIRQGALQFCTREVFRELGGYDTTIYVGEDIEFHWRLDKVARDRGAFTTFIEEPKVLTSSRRWEKMGLFRMLILTHPITIFLAWRMPSFWKDWYEDAVR